MPFVVTDRDAATSSWDASKWDADAGPVDAGGEPGTLATPTAEAPSEATDSPMDGGAGPDSRSNAGGGWNTRAQYLWDLPAYASPPPVPEGNPMSEAKVALGRRLFYEGRYALDGELSCAGCHAQETGFAVPEAVHVGASGDATPRNAPGLANIAYAAYLTWGNLTLITLEQQGIVPLFNDTPIEMGVGFVMGSADHFDPSRLHDLVEADAAYAALFDAAFPDVRADVRVSWDGVIAALASFQRTMMSFDSPYDGYLQGRADALSAEQEHGRALFFSDRLRCGECHSGPLLSAAFPTDGTRPARSEAFRNNGLYHLDLPNSGYLSGEPSHYPQPNMGIGEFTQDPADDGKHRIPSLRNVAVTAPYMHDGSLPTLDAVLDHYARGGTLTPSGPLAGDGRSHPAKDPLVAGFELGDDDRAALLAFFGALTDVSFLDRRELAP